MRLNKKEIQVRILVCKETTERNRGTKEGNQTTQS
jgi:hypothetical protein